MTTRDLKAGPGRYGGMKLSETSQGNLPNAECDIDQPPNQTALSSKGPDEPMKLGKRQADEIDQSAVKRPRLSTEVEEERAQPADEVQ